MKEYNPIEVKEFSTAHGVSEEPTFEQWVPCTLQKRDTIISAANAQVKLTTHKYDVAIPCSVKESYTFDTKNGNTLWRDALYKEISNLQVAFNILDTNWNHLPGWLKMSGHIIFDVIITLEQKARWVKYGHRNPEPEKLDLRW